MRETERYASLVPDWRTDGECFRYIGFGMAKDPISRKMFCGNFFKGRPGLSLTSGAVYASPF